MTPNLLSTCMGKLKSMQVSTIAGAILLFSLSASAQLSLSVSKTDPSCFGYTNGTASASASNGVAPYVFKWSNGTTGNNLFGLNKGTYTVTVTDAASKTATSSVTIVEPAQIASKFTFADVCNNGAISVSATGGTSPFTFSWGGGRTGATQTLPQGGYNVTVTDNKGCTASNFLNVPGAFGLNLKIGKLRCFGDCDAAVDALPQGGTTPITYKWNNGAITQAIVGIPAGTYSVTATDANGCTATASGTVINPAQINVTTTVVSPSCGGGANGSATASATGGSSPFTFAWSNGQKTATATNLNVGTYSVTATDANGCAKVANVTIATQANFTVSVSKTDAACGSSNGSATVSTSGTTGAVTYKWSTGATTASINNIAAGNYTVTVVDGTGCSNVGSVTVNSSGGNLSASIQKTDATCGIANGVGMVVVASGTAPYTYKWNTGNTESVLKTLGAGNYTITVSDAAGCSTILQFSIATSTSFTVTTDVKNVSCNGGTDGQITAMIMGGSAPYTYTWSNGGNVNTIVNLKAGSYNVSVKDASGCTGSATASVLQPDAIVIAISTSATSCNSSNGNLNATVTGGYGALKYQWSNGATTASVSNLSAGSYSLTVTDTKGCTAVKSATVSSSSGVSLTVNVSNPVCSDGSGAATATVSGGATPYKYAWSNGASTPSVNGLTGGNYTVSVTDNNGCVAVQNFAVNTPLPITVSVTTQGTTCGSNNGVATATLVNGGTAPFTYSWSNGAKTASISNLAANTYSVTVTDANGCSGKNSAVITASSATTVSISSTNTKCNGSSDGSATATVSDNSSPYQFTWSNGTKTATISNLKAGTYSVTATNITGCTATGSVTITQPAAIVVSTTSTNATCLPTGSATVTASNGVAPYKFAWSNGATTATINNVAGGNYTVTVTDANNCAVTTTATVQALTSPNLTVKTSIVTSITEQGSAKGSVTATATGGSEPYSYAWSNGNLVQTIDNLIAGTYSVTVTDKNGCTAITSIVLTEPTCNQITDPGTIKGDQRICNQSDLFAITQVTPASGGSGAIEYMWMYSEVEGAFSLSHYKLVPGSVNTPNLIVFPTITKTTYIARCVRNAGCGYFRESNFVTITPTVNAVIDGPSDVCLGSVATYSTPNANGFYDWTISRATNPTGNTASISTKFITTGQQNVRLTVTVGACTRTVVKTVNVVSCVGASGTIFAFTTKINNPKNIQLDWQTQNELIPSEYQIEHSNDGITFDVMAKVPSQNNGQNAYTFVDQNPKVGRNFYRIKHMEGTGEISFSDMRQNVIFSAQGDVITYPNPTQNKMFVELLNGDTTDGTIEVFNSFGRIVKTQAFTKDQNRYELDLTELSAGVFIVRLTTVNGDVKTVKVNRS